MPEIPPQAVQAAVRAVLDHPWDATRRSEHSAHTYDAGCAVCQGDVAEILAVAFTAGERPASASVQTAPESTQAGERGRPRFLGSTDDPITLETPTALRDRYAAAIRENAWPGLTVRNAVEAVLRVRDDELAALRAERDLAVAHDRQPYPTAWAYDQACKALREQRERAGNAEQRVELARQALLADGFFTADQVGPDVAPRILERLAALRERADVAEAAVARYENTITWNTTCHGCAGLLDASYAETRRAEQAEAAIARVRELHTPFTYEQTTTCTYCSKNAYPNYEVLWPCPTIRALDGGEQAGGNA